ncbi:MAG: hypothetical protein ABI878_05685 [Acidobacteriota bacterium]
MSLQGKIRDELYGSEDQERAVDGRALALERIADETNAFQTLKVFVICVLIEAATIVLIFFWPHTVRGFLSVGSAWPFWLGVPFLVGILIGLTGFKLVRESISRCDPPIDGVLSGYAEDLKRERQFTIWFVAAGAGVSNLILLYFLLVGVKFF